MRALIYSLIPLLVLLIAISLACLLGYFIVLGIGEPIPLRKIISKITQLLLILSIFPTMKMLRIDKTQLGFAKRSVFVKQLAQGFGLGLVTLIPVFLALYALGVTVVDDAKPWTVEFIGKKMLVSLILALVISLIEEPLFRGILISGLRKKLSLYSAILVSALYYAGLHFLNSSIEIPQEAIHLFSGFTLLADALAHLFRPEIISAFIALVMVGVFLALIRTQLHTSLGLCIGCHTCWVWQIKMNKSLFNTDFNSNYAYLVSHYDGVIGPLVSGWLLLAVLAFWAYQKPMIESSF
jgi:membrane protease YdiL (CAAX protease family)